MRSRSAARAVALQALYQFDLRGDEFEPYLQGFLREWARGEEARGYAERLVGGCLMAQAELDGLLVQKVENWALPRISAVDRSILRLAAYEMLYEPDVPPKVAIDEAVRLAKRYGSEESGRFVNGVLDRIMAGLAHP